MDSAQQGELISRQAAIDAITEYGDRRNLYMSVGELKRRIEQLPCAEPQIIRCKDCKHFKQDIPCVGGTYNGCDEWLDDGNESPVGWFGYCHKAERKKDGQI